jgi:hypothetical protein
VAKTVLLADNPLWRFACALYAVPGIADICIRLQDETRWRQLEGSAGPAAHAGPAFPLLHSGRLAYVGK